MTTNYFKELNSIDCSQYIEQKNGLTYLSWAYAWQTLKLKYPLSFYTIYENADGWNYHTDGRTAWVKTGVTIVADDGTTVEHIEMLPVMDNRNRSIALENITSFDVNKAIQRSLTKAVARHGLGIYIYAGEDLPSSTRKEQVMNLLLENEKALAFYAKKYKVKTADEFTDEQYEEIHKELKQNGRV